MSVPADKVNHEEIGDVETLILKLLEMQKTPQELEEQGFTLNQIQMVLEKNKPIAGKYIKVLKDYRDARAQPVVSPKQDLEEDFVFVENNEEYESIDNPLDARSATSSNVSTPLKGSPFKP